MTSPSKEAFHDRLWHETKNDVCVCLSQLIMAMKADVTYALLNPGPTGWWPTLLRLASLHIHVGIVGLLRHQYDRCLFNNGI